MKRRRFFQYVGLGSVGFWAGVNGRVLAASPSLETPPSSARSSLPLKTIAFSVVTLDAQGRQASVQPHSASYYEEVLSPGVTLPMMVIPAGESVIGASAPDRSGAELRAESPAHPVHLSTFALGRYPVTQAQWTVVATTLPKVNRDLDSTPSAFPDPHRPVECVSWLEAVEFCDRLSAYTGRSYRLPSEAEWEYACRAGTTTPFHTGVTLSSEVANYIGHYTYKSEAKGEYRKMTTPVGRFSPNAFGLHDMHGNVWEWCADAWHTNYQGAPRDGRVWEGSSALRSLRGGSWSDPPTKLRSASRMGSRAETLNRLTGFRVCSDWA